jgi:hypothetical protein
VPCESEKIPEESDENVALVGFSLFSKGKYEGKKPTMSIRLTLMCFSVFLTSEGIGLSSPAWRSGWAGWWAAVWRDCGQHLAAPGTRLLQDAATILAAVAGTLIMSVNIRI